MGSRLGVIVTSLWVLAATPAFAQVAGGVASYPTCGARAPSSDDVATAKKTYELGNRYMSEADYDRAIYYFRDAYRSDCTAHKLLGFIARAYELKSERAEAIRALETYLERSPGADDRGTVERRVANLKSQLATQPASPTPPPPTPPSTGRPSSATATVTTTTAPPAEALVAKRHHMARPWILFGVGAAVGVGGAAVAITGATMVHSAENACGGSRVCASQSETTRGNTGRTMEPAGIAIAAAGAAAMAGGLIWHFVEPTDASDPKRVSAALAPTLGPGTAGLSMHGAF